MSVFVIPALARLVRELPERERREFYRELEELGLRGEIRDELRLAEPQDAEP